MMGGTEDKEEGQTQFRQKAKHNVRDETEQEWLLRFSNQLRQRNIIDATRLN